MTYLLLQKDANIGKLRHYDQFPVNCHITQGAHIWHWQHFIGSLNYIMSLLTVLHIKEQKILKKLLYDSSVLDYKARIQPIDRGEII